MLDVFYLNLYICLLYFFNSGNNLPRRANNKARHGKST